MLQLYPRHDKYISSLYVLQWDTGNYVVVYQECKRWPKNGTNQGLIQIRFCTFWLGESDLKKSRIFLFRANISQFGPTLDILIVCNQQTSYFCCGTQLGFPLDKNMTSHLLVMAVHWLGEHVTFQSHWNKVVCICPNTVQINPKWDKS